MGGKEFPLLERNSSSPSHYREHSGGITSCVSTPRKEFIFSKLAPFIRICPGICRFHSSKGIHLLQGYALRPLVVIEVWFPLLERNSSSPSSQRRAGRMLATIVSTPRKEFIFSKSPGCSRSLEQYFLFPLLERNSSSPSSCDPPRCPRFGDSFHSSKGIHLLQGKKMKGKALHRTVRFHSSKGIHLLQVLKERR